MSDSYSEMEINAAWENWDPMTAASQSFMNTMSFRIDDPGSIHLGGSSINDVKNIQCPFQKEPNKPCFKGTSCKYKHGKYTPAILQQHPKLDTDINQRNVLTMAFNLPKKIIPSDGFVTMAWITMAQDPSEFYVVSKDTWNCLCQSGNDLDNSEVSPTSHKNCGFNDLSDLCQNMQNYFSVKGRQSNEYIAGEIVAVRLELSTGKGWFRAVVLEDAADEREGNQAAIVSMKLLDFGTEIKKSTLDIVPLPRNFAYVGPMAFKCQLFGISPIMGTWGKKATNFFKELINGQLVIAEVKRTVYPDVDGIFNLFEKSPILLTLYVKQGGNYINVTKEMTDRGLGIEWNPYPYRPLANNLLPRWKYEYVVQEIQTEQDQQNLQNAVEKIMIREKSRMNRYIERLKCQHDMD